MATEQKFKQTEIGLIPEDWDVEVFSNVIAINPKRDIKKGTTARKISMQKLIEFKRKIDGFELSEFKGGSKFQNEDTLMARITPCLENGKTAYVDILEDNEIAFGSTEFIVLSGKYNLTRNDFVYYLAISPKIRRIAIQSMTGTSGRQRIQADLLGDVEIGIPSLEEQKSIAKILSDLDSKIELLQKQNKTLEAIGQAIFKHWFVDFEFPNEEGKPYKSSGGEMVFNEELEKEIPKGWEVGSPMRLASFKNGKSTTLATYAENGLYPLIGSNGEIGRTDKKIVDQPSIIIGRVGANCGSLHYSLEPCWISDNAIFAIPKLTSEYPFVLMSFKRLTFRDLRAGSAQPLINQTSIKTLRLIIPPHENIDNFSKNIRSILSKIQSNMNENRSLSKIRDSLLPKLMSGKIRVLNNQKIEEAV